MHVTHFFVYSFDHFCHVFWWNLAGSILSQILLTNSKSGCDHALFAAICGPPKSVCGKFVSFLMSAHVVSYQVRKYNQFTDPLHISLCTSYSNISWGIYMIESSWLILVKNLSDPNISCTPPRGSLPGNHTIWVVGGSGDMPCGTQKQAHKVLKDARP